MRCDDEEKALELPTRSHFTEVSMKSSLLSAFFVAHMVVGAACASNSGSTGTGGASGSGGTSSAGGSTSSGGSGGDERTGGAVGSGGAQESGGTQGTGGMQDTGGTPGGAGGGMTGGTGGGATGGAGGSATGGSGGSATGGSAGGAPGDAGQATGGSTSGVGTGGALAGDGGRVDTQDGGVIRARTIETRGFTFDALEAGSDGEPVLLLHGFPDTSLEWTALMPVLAAAGYHCLAPDQRGYSPGARPTEVDAYKYAELVADAFAFGSELGERFHVVAHDWGANIAWLMLQKDPSRIASYTAIAVPHYAVWARAVYDDPDMAQYLSMLNTWMTPDKGEAFWTASAMRNMWTAKPADLREATIAHMTEPGCMTAALNWYRASDGHKSVIEDFEIWEVNVPTLLIFGSKDVGQGTLARSAPYMKGPYRVVQPVGAHFIVDEQPKVVADETLAHLRAYPIQ
jgi:pimeloyl-ACP methyl ester carboxylesterase